MHHTSVLTALLLPLAASAAPLTPRTVSDTQYEIAVLKTHFMGKNSGIANGDWPPNSAFNSTINFTVAYPQGASTACSANWTYGTHPAGWTRCDDDAVAWRFSDFTNEGTFTLEVARKTTEDSTTSGSVDITSDNLADQSSWLTCLGGPPLDGIRCNLDGPMSKQKAPIPVSVAAGPAIDF